MLDLGAIYIGMSFNKENEIEYYLTLIATMGENLFKTTKDKRGKAIARIAKALIKKLKKLPE